MKARAALEVTCRNCDHASFISYHFLKERFGLYASVLDANFRCRVCGSKNVKLAAAAEETARIRLSPTMHFAGIYEGKLMD